MMDIPEGVFSEAVRRFWETRDVQARRQRERGDTDRGSRSAVTGGRQMDGFIETIVQLLRQAEIPKEIIYFGRRLTHLPGYYRPSKEWDLVIATQDRLLAVLELKSQVGPSFGNNFNNRVEEALGSAVDLWTAYREGILPHPSAPWLRLFASSGGVRSIEAAGAGSRTTLSSP